MIIRRFLIIQNRDLDSTIFLIETIVISVNVSGISCPLAPSSGHFSGWQVALSENPF